MVLGIPSELFSGLIGALIGAIIALVGQYVLNWNRRRIRRGNLRQALISEILSSRLELLVQQLYIDWSNKYNLSEQVEGSFEEVKNFEIKYAQDEDVNEFWEGFVDGLRNEIQQDSLGLGDPIVTNSLREGKDVLFPTVIFKNNINEIGRLEPEEIDHLINYYNSVFVIKSFLESDIVRDHGNTNYADKEMLEFGLLTFLSLSYFLKKETLEALGYENHQTV